ncbi:MAG: hypothetical protein ABH871_08475 [Pseudomonadota bacterium]
MNIPFFPNTGDGTHCFQAAMKMALAKLLPEREFSYEELDRISLKLPGRWTWPTAAMLWMIEKGLEVKLIEQFDYADFAKRGGEYLIERYGKEVGGAQIEHSDVEFERDISLRFSKIAPIELRPAYLEDLQKEMARGAVVIVNLNACVLQDQEGYSGHFVVMCDIGDKEIRLHDPGFPPMPNVIVPVDRFIKAWAYPTACDRNLLSISCPTDFVFKE